MEVKINFRAKQGVWKEKLLLLNGKLMIDDRPEMKYYFSLILLNNESGFPCSTGDRHETLVEGSRNQ